VWLAAQRETVTPEAQETPEVLEAPVRSARTETLALEEILVLPGTPETLAPPVPRAIMAASALPLLYFP
jgi:hypothetical protein